MTWDPWEGNLGILDLFSTRDVILDLGAMNKASLLELLAAEVAQRSGRTTKEVLEALKARERIGSTALGNGIALPHAEFRDGLSPSILFARLLRPLGFEAADDQPVDLIFVVLWPAANRKAFLDVMAEICRMLRDGQVLRRLRSAATPEEVVQVLHEAADDGAEQTAGSEGKPGAVSDDGDQK
jgi:PTS system nitrogen regulatory IIA component